MNYSVDNGQLHVLGFEPAYSDVTMTAYLEPIVGDFRAETTFDMEAGGARYISWGLNGHGGFTLLLNPIGQSFFRAGLEGHEVIELPLLSPGLHTFTLHKYNGITRVLLDDELITEGVTSYEFVTWTSWYFQGATSDVHFWRPLDVDYVYVAVPEPSPIAGIMLATLILWRKKHYGKRMGTNSP